MSIVLKLKTYWCLGPKNVLQVGLYRLGLRTGLHPVVRLKRQIGGHDFFVLPNGPSADLATLDTWRESALYFGWHEESLSGGAPAWHRNPFNDRNAEGQGQPWWRLSDFDLAVGDIKCVWEASRFDWVLAMAQRAATGDAAELTRLNTWLSDWCSANPAYLGVNWKCGQEASIRVMHLLLAARLLGQDQNPSDDLLNLVEAHLARIQPTLSYALAQDNNHGTSEAAALFMGGTFCAEAGLPRGKAWALEGRRWLENRASRLVGSDGSFSQYSVNYHRLMLDTVSLAELWRRWQDLPPFSPTYQSRARAAAEWLFHLVDAKSGGTPNLGANDGANLLPLTAAEYGDNRPSVQLAMALFADQRAYAGQGPHQCQLDWLQVEAPEVAAPAPGSRHFPDGGYAVLRQGNWTALMKYPRYRFRPYHCDALHLDLWREGKNLLRDDGTFSYHAEEPWRTYFSSTSAHNTVTFDGHDQMPSTGRFLRGAWLSARGISFNTDTASATYVDGWGARHQRQVEVRDAEVRVTDRVDGFADRAVLRWRLAPGQWTLQGSELRGEDCNLTVRADVEISRIELTEGWESRHYLHKSPLPVLEVELKEAGILTTEILWKY